MKYAIAKELWKEGKLKLCEADVEVMESDLGTFVEYRGKEVGQKYCEAFFVHRFIT